MSFFTQAGLGCLRLYLREPPTTGVSHRWSDIAHARGTCWMSPWVLLYLVFVIHPWHHCCLLVWRAALREFGKMRLAAAGGWRPYGVFRAAEITSELFYQPPPQPRRNSARPCSGQPFTQRKTVRLRACQTGPH